MHPDDDRRLTTADLSGADVARIASSNAAAAVAERIIPIVATTDDEKLPPGGLLCQVNQARRVLNELMTCALTYERLNGATWEDIAKALGTDPADAVLNYKYFDWGHLADDPRALWHEFNKSSPAPAPGGCPHDPAEAARKLDDWAVRHHDPREKARRATRPVTAGLGK
ncbi:hypothetical protein ACQP25_44410 (plasmid) [Microtetraspora malaysiensis]|uniref:hypothetical protein n=1 Tax=Microtetraspora malaysiensis TaxID=161358 RepID=UPI003D91547E